MVITILVPPRASIAYKVAYEQKHYAVIAFANEESIRTLKVNLILSVSDEIS